MIVEEIYHKGLISADPEMKVKDALHLMDKKDIGGLPVLKGDDLVGILSLQDIAAKTVPDEFKANPGLALAMNSPTFFKEMCDSVAEMKVKDIMRKDFLKVDLKTNIMAVMTDFLLKDLYHVPVVDENDRVIGIVARNEIKKALLSRM